MLQMLSNPLAECEGAGTAPLAPQLSPARADQFQDIPCAALGMVVPGPKISPLNPASLRNL